MRYSYFAIPFVLAGCDVMDGFQPASAPRAPSSIEEGPPPPPPDARSIEDFDTTTAEERREATAPASGGAFLGETVATLGDIGKSGFWVETALVSETRTGRIRYPINGRSVEVELRPVSGSTRVSLAALRLLDAPLTDLVTVELFGS